MPATPVESCRAPSMPSEFFIGLMSGTSLDGIDAVLACFDRPDAALATQFIPFPDDLRADLTGLLASGPDEVHRGALTANRLSTLYAQAVSDLIELTGMHPTQIRAIGCHGQTIRHMPGAGYTVQIGNGALLAESTGITVVCDFRSRDVAAGGQGAPLVPAFHARMFASNIAPRAVVNIGGIANITWLPTDGPVIGFDCGPGNALMDEWIAEVSNLKFDADGAWAAQGTVITSLLSALMAEPYLAISPPKSTGRELFNLKWARPHFHADYASADVQATLCEYTAATVADAIERHCPGTTEVYVCGGGASNTVLMGRIKARLSPRVRIDTTAALGIHPDWVEALAFAWLARETLAGRPGNLPAVTGAHGPRILGCIYPA